MLAFGLGHAEDREHPALVQARPARASKIRRSPSSRIARAPVGQRVAGHAVRARSATRSAAPLQPRDGRPHRRLVHAELGHQPDDRGDAQPAADLAGVQAVDRDDERARLLARAASASPSATVTRPTGTSSRALDCRHQKREYWDDDDAAARRSARSAHVDTFCRDNLPPPRRGRSSCFDLPELQYPEQLNCAEELLDADDRAARPRPALLSSRPTARAWTYGDLADQVEPHRPRARRGPRRRARQPGAAARAEQLLAGGSAGWRWSRPAPSRSPPCRCCGRPRSSPSPRSPGRGLALCDARFVADLTRGRRARPAGRHLRRRRLGRRPDRPQRDQADRRSPPSTTAADDVALLAFTSGTTGRPEGDDALPPRRARRSPTPSARTCPAAADDVFTGTPPLGFTFGLGGLLIFPLRAGAATLLIERATPDELAEIIAEHGVTVCFTAPTAYRAMLRRRACRQAGRRCAARSRPASTCPSRPGTRFHDATGLRLIDGIGSTEMLHVFISAADDDIRPGATGRAVPGYQADGPRRGRRTRPPPGTPRPAGGEGPDRLPLPGRRPPGGLRPATAGTSPATPSSATRTATSGTRPAPTT